MFCGNCGREIPDDAGFCPECGASFQSVQTGNRQGKPVKKKKSHKWIWILLGIVMAAVIGFFVIVLLTPTEEGEYVKKVKNGYLGYYSKVTVAEVLESYKPNGEWIQGKKDGEDAHLVEYGTDDFRVQFYIADDDDEFCVIMIKRNGKNIENEDARCAALNQIYEEYVSKHKDCGFKADYDSVPLLGHVRKSKAGYVVESEEKTTQKITEKGTEKKTEKVTEKSNEFSSKEASGLYEDPWSGSYAYKDMVLDIAHIGSRYVVLCYYTNGELFYENEWYYIKYDEDSDYLACDDKGVYYIGRNEDGSLWMTSGVGRPWGQFVRTSGAGKTDTYFSGKYGDESGDFSFTHGSSMFFEYIEYGESCGSMHIQYLNTDGDVIKYDGYLYKQEDGSMAIYDDINGLLGMVTIANGKAKITGSTFDGVYPCKELYTS